MEKGEYSEVDETSDVLGAETQTDKEQANVESHRVECNVQAKEQIEQEIDRSSEHPEGKLLVVEGCEMSPEETFIIEKMESILKKEKYDYHNCEEQIETEPRKLSRK